MIKQQGSQQILVVPRARLRKISYVQCQSVEKPVVSRRGKKLIDTSNVTIRNYINTVKGRSSDTKQLNINLKTITDAFLRTAVMQRELNDGQMAIVNRYGGLSANFNSLRYLLYGSSQICCGGQRSSFCGQHSEQFNLCREQLRSMVREYYKSNDFLINFMRSSRMHIKNKLVILKYMQRIQRMTYRDFGLELSWKNIRYFQEESL